MDGLDKTDDGPLSKISSLQKDKTQSLTDVRNDTDNKLVEHEKHFQVEHDSIGSEIHVLNQHSEEVKTLHITTKKRIG